MNENWKPIPGYEGLYEVSDLGRVRSQPRQRTAGGIRRPTRRSGYMAVGLCKGGLVTTHNVHRLVLEAFRGPCPPSMECCHGDGDRAHNALDNLRWDTKRANNADKIAHGTDNRGERHPNAALIDGGIERIFDLRRAGCLQREIGDWIGTSQAHVSRILLGQSRAQLEAAA